ncbi:hypothetical protein NPIL_209281, partial [Nephila pilipes]
MNAKQHFTLNVRLSTMANKLVGSDSFPFRLDSRKHLVFLQGTLQEKSMSSHMYDTKCGFNIMRRLLIALD